jgi:hypothetical protein
MRTIEIEPRAINEDDYLGRYASVDDVEHIIDEDTILTVNGEVVLAYVRDFADKTALEDFRERLGQYPFGLARRASSKSLPIKSESAVFGYQPRLALRPNTQSCRVGSMYRQDRQLHDMLLSVTHSVTKVYDALAPEAAAHHRKETESRILPEYRIPQSMFTSGIVNKSNQLPYHYDSGNFVGAWSAMLGLSKHVSGGYLAVPEYNLALAITDGSLSFFDGQARVHGVTPFKRTHPDAERYTVVWYSLRKLWECLTNREEIALINERTTAQNRKKAKRD